MNDRERDREIWNKFTKNKYIDTLFLFPKIGQFLLTFFTPEKRIILPRNHIENGRNVNKVNLNQIAFIKIKVN